MNYSKALKIIRATKGLSQQQFSAFIGINPSLLSRIESGQRSLSKGNLKKISTKMSIPESLIKLLAVDKGGINGLSKEEHHSLAKSLLTMLMNTEYGLE